VPDVSPIGACTAVGGVGVAAVNDTVAPSGANGKTNVDMVFSYLDSRASIRAMSS